MRTRSSAPGPASRPGRPIVVAALTAVGLGVAATPATAATTATVSTTTTAHNNVQVGKEGSPVSNIRVTSTGTDPLTITGLALTGATPDQWKIRVNTCFPAGSTQVTLATGEFCTVTVAMLPTSTGAKSAAVALTSNSPTALTSSTFSGTARNLEFSTDKLDFGPTDNGTTSAPKTVTVTNRDATTYTLGAVTTSSSAGFVKGTDTCSSAVLAKDQSCSVDVTFTPTTLGAKTGTVAIGSFSPVGTTLAGESVGRAVGVAPLSRSFAQQPVGTPSAAEPVRLTNTGNGPVAVSGVELVGADAGDFALQDDACTGRSVAPGASCVVGVRFSAAREGWRTAGVRFTSDAQPGVVIARVSGRAGTSILGDAKPGSPYAFSTLPAARLVGDGEDGVGGALANGPCDVNGDGHDDVIAGASTWSRRPADLSWEGATYVRFGGPDLGTGDLQNPATTGALRIEGEDTSAWRTGTGSQSGFSVDCAGDVDGDGIDDLVIGAWNYAYEGRGTGANVGRAYVVYGAKDLQTLGSLDLSLLGSRGFRISGADKGQYDHLGFVVAGVGDVDGDGLDDVAVGANTASTEVAPTRSGMAYVVAGRRTGGNVDLDAPDSTIARINNGVPGTAGGSSGQLNGLAGVGDVNGDGVPDLAYGSITAQPFGAGRSAAGALYVITGRARGTVDVAKRQGVLLAAGGAFASHRLGITVGAAGDVNGDGLQDVIAGADSTASANSDAAYVFYGRRDATDETIDTAVLPSSRGYRILGAPGSSTGYGVTGIGDIDGDGNDDLLVSGYATGSSRGAAWLVRGVPDATVLPQNEASLGLVPANAADTTRTQVLATLTAAEGGRLDGSFAGDRFGRSVGLVGDAAGDGGVSVALGADGATRRGRTGSGEVTVVALPGKVPAPVLPPKDPDPVDPTPGDDAPGGTTTPGTTVPGTTTPATPNPVGPTSGGAAATTGRSAVVAAGASRTLALDGRVTTLALRRTGGTAGRVRVAVRTLRAVKVGSVRRVLRVTADRVVRVAGTGTLRLHLGVAPEARRVLARNGRLTVKVTVTSLDDGGRTSTRTMTLRRGGTR